MLERGSPDLHRAELLGHRDLAEPMVSANESDRRRCSLCEEQRARELHGVIRSQGVPFDELARQIRRGSPHLHDDHFREVLHDLLHEILRPRLGQIAFARPAPERGGYLDP